MLTLNDGRKELYQWDTGRTATVDIECDVVHFSNLKYGESLAVEVKEGEVSIPNKLLMSGEPIYCWAFVKDDSGSYTKKEQTFTVIKRAKPSDYVYTETEVITIKTAVEKALEKAKESGEFKGEKGDTGATGPMGPQGETGATGAAGANGTSVTVSSVSESTSDGGENIVTFSDGKALTVKNGSKGSQGVQGIKGNNGTDGVSPTVEIEAITGGTKVTITDKNGTHEFNVMNGVDGAPGSQGEKGDPTDVQQTTGQSTKAVMSQKATTDEIAALKSDLSKIETEHFPFNYGYTETQNGYYSKFSSNFTPDLSYVSKKMEVTEGDICCITCSTPKALGFAMCYFWDENMNVISYLNENADESGNQYTNEIVEVPQNARYIVTTGRVVYECKLAKLSYEPTSLPLKGKNIVNLGDSIFGNNNTLTGVSSLLAKETYANVINCAFGGTKMVIREGGPSGYELFDFGHLVNAIVSGNFTYQNNAIAGYNLPDYYAGRLQILRNVDFSKVDIVTLNYSTNDYAFGVPKATLKQAYIDTVSALQTAYPNLIVVIISPTWRCWLNDDGSFKEDSNSKIWWSHGDSTLVDYCNTLQETAKELNVQYIDVYNIGINKNTWTHYFTSDDTTHQNENGRKRIAEVIASNLY